MFIATLVAANGLAGQPFNRLLAEAGCTLVGVELIEADQVVRLRCEGDSVQARVALEALSADVFVRGEGALMPRLLVADMDSTMITVECIDELADYAGVKAEVADVTERAMRGELDFAAALQARVALLKGLPTETLTRCLEERVRVTPGARTLIGTLKRHGASTLLVTGGFEAFAQPIAAAIGFDAFRANRLGIENGLLDGLVVPPIIDADGKLAALREASTGFEVGETLAVGDGANDVPMLRGSGYGIAYHGKPAAVAAADAAVRFGDLTGILHGLGIPRAAWVEV